MANLTKLFKELHFKTTHKQNLTILEFKKELKSLADNPENESADMMILVVLSHGREGQIITSDGRGVDTEEIYAQFNNVNCPKLKGKPKFFIVQACRGTDIDISALPMDAEESVSLHDDRVRFRFHFTWKKSSETLFRTDWFCPTLISGEKKINKFKLENKRLKLIEIQGNCPIQFHEKM